MKATVKWLDHMSFVGESGSGHSVVMDGAPDVGGRNMGVRPMEMVEKSSSVALTGTSVP